MHSRNLLSKASGELLRFDTDLNRRPSHRRSKVLNIVTRKFVKIDIIRHAREVFVTQYEYRFQNHEPCLVAFNIYESCVTSSESDIDSFITYQLWGLNLQKR